MPQNLTIIILDILLSFIQVQIPWIYVTDSVDDSAIGLWLHYSHQYFQSFVSIHFMLQAFRIRWIASKWSICLNIIQPTTVRPKELSVKFAETKRYRDVASNEQSGNFHFSNFSEIWWYIPGIGAYLNKKCGKIVTRWFCRCGIILIPMEKMLVLRLQ